MSHYLIYVPQRHIEAAAKSDSSPHPLEYVGLADHVAGAFQVGIGDGPDRKGGGLFGWVAGTAQHRLHYRADDQDWIPALPRGDEPAQRYWVGFWKNAPVVPEDLRRAEFVGGTRLTLGDGCEWIIPAMNRVPMRGAIGEDGRWTQVVQQPYREWWHEAVTWHQTRARGQANFEWADVYEFATRCLRLNYRFAPELVNHRELLRDQDAAAIFRAATMPVLPEVSGG